MKIEEKVTISTTISKETFQKIVDIIEFSKFKSAFSDFDLPTNEENVFKAALYHYLKHMEKLEMLNDFHKENNLNSKKKLKNNLKKIADHQGLKQKDISELTGIDPGNISIIFKNTRSQPSIDYFLRIWVALECPPVEDCFYRIKE
jgi:predicted XRE-type DNA-binding protein